MKILALDLSKTNTGWAVWDGASAKPLYGSWVLGSEYSSDGMVFAKVHERMMEHHQVFGFEYVAIEAPISPAQLQGNTTIQTIRLASGIAAHVHSFAHAFGLRPVIEVNVSSWRPDFIGKIHDQQAKADARRRKKAGDSRASARDSLKALTIARCRQLGMTPKKDDEADAIGILTYCLLTRNVQPPWMMDETLLAPLEVAR